MIVTADSARIAPLWALLPVKDFGRAKSRLAPVLDAAARSALARQLCEHALDTLRSYSEIAGILVISDSEAVLSVAQKYGALGVRETPSAAPRVLGAIVDEGLALIESRGAQAALVLMADLPQLHIAELSPLLHSLQTHDYVVTPDRREQNTNALALRLAGRAPTAFGSGDSFRRHTEILSAAGRRVAIHRAPGLALDIDFPEDYALLNR